MEILHRFRYDPSWRFILFELALAPITAAGVWLQLVARPIGIAGVGFFIIASLLLIARRLIFHRYIEVFPDGLLVPTGFLQVWTTRLKFSEITQVAEASLPLTVGLIIKTEKRRVAILSFLFVNVESYLALRQFVVEQCPEFSAPTPTTSSDWALRFVGRAGRLLAYTAAPVGIVCMLTLRTLGWTWEHGFLLGASVALIAAMIGTHCVEIQKLLTRNKLYR
jgi:hypothetical protein